MDIINKLWNAYTSRKMRKHIKQKAVELGLDLKNLKVVIRDGDYGEGDILKETTLDKLSANDLDILAEKRIRERV